MPRSVFDFLFPGTRQASVLLPEILKGYGVEEESPVGRLARQPARLVQRVREAPRQVIEGLIKAPPTAGGPAFESLSGQTAGTVGAQPIAGGIQPPPPRTIPSVYGGEPKPFKATYGGPPLNTEAALTGLRSTSSNLDPILGRIAAQSRMRSTLRPQDIELGNLYESRLWSELAGDRAALASIEQAIKAQHPAIQAEREQAARREAYPAQATSIGQTQAADIAGRYRLGAAEETSRGRKQAARGTMGAAAIRGLAQNLPKLQGESDDDYEARIGQMLDVLDAFLAQNPDVNPEDLLEDLDLQDEF